MEEAVDVREAAHLGVFRVEQQVEDGPHHGALHRRQHPVHQAAGGLELHELLLDLRLLRGCHCSQVTGRSSLGLVE